MAASARTLGLLAAVLAIALLVNGYFLYEAFIASSSGAHFRIVLKPDHASSLQSVMTELGAIPGVKVEQHEDRHTHRKPTGHFWVGREVAQDVAITMERNLQGLHRRVVRLDVDEGKSVVRLAEEFATQAQAQRVQHQVDAELKVLTVNILPSFKVENIVDTQLDVTLADPSEQKSVQAVANKHDLPLEPVKDDP